MPLVVLGVDPHKQSHTATALGRRVPSAAGHPPDPGQPAGYQPAAGLGPAVPTAPLGGRERPWAGLSSHPMAARPWRDGPGRAHHRHRAGPGAVAGAWPQDRCAGRSGRRSGRGGAGQRRHGAARGRHDGAGGVGGAAQQPGRPAHRSVNQLHAVLRELIAGGAPRKLRADRAAQLLRAVCPATAADRTRKQGRQGLACSAVGDAPSMTVLKEGRRRGPNAEPPVRSFGNARTCAADGCATRLSRYNPAPCCYRHEGWDLEQRTRPRRHGPESPLAPDHGRRSSCGLSASSSTRWLVFLGGGRVRWLIPDRRESHGCDSDLGRADDGRGDP